MGAISDVDAIAILSHPARRTSAGNAHHRSSSVAIAILITVAIDEGLSSSSTLPSQSLSMPSQGKTASAFPGLASGSLSSQSTCPLVGARGVVFAGQEPQCSVPGPPGE